MELEYKISSGKRGFQTKQVINRLGLINVPKTPSLCLCSCNEITWNGTEYKKGHQPIERRNLLSDGSWYPCIPTICNCKYYCNEIVYDGNEFLSGHHSQSRDNKVKEILRISNKRHLKDGTFYPCIPDLCWCSCGETVWNGRRFRPQHYEIVMNVSGDKNPFFNKHHTKEVKEYLSFKGRRENLSEETLNKMSEASKRRVVSQERKDELSIIMCGSGNPMFGVPSPMKGIKGKDHPAYIDGRSESKYCYKWTSKLREEVRIRDSHTCQHCGITQEEHKLKTGKILCVHHIHYDKQTCYPDLITLCISCNSKVNSKSLRIYYESLFMNKLNDHNLLFWTRRNIK